MKKSLHKPILMIPIWLRMVLLLLLACAIARGASAQGGQSDLTQLSIEDLMNIEITSASRKEQRAEDVAAAVYVVTADEIRRSGARTLPELFRLVPGVQVAQINANNWGVTIRGFNDVLPNKLLVLLDGRSIYNRAYSGVFWNTIDLLIDDIERIEVIRGPGGSTWGANAVNGVINVVTKKATDSKGGLIRAGGGTLGDSEGAVRYGGAVGSVAYRAYSQWADYGRSVFDDGSNANDVWKTFTNGVRADWSRGSNALMFDGSVVHSNAQMLWLHTDASLIGIPANPDRSTITNRQALTSRWTHTESNGAALQVQGFVDFWRLDSPDVLQSESVYDVDVQYHRRVGSRHDVIVGGGYRDADVRTNGSFTYSLSPTTSEQAVLNFFGEDEIALSRSLKVTVGSKIEHDTTSQWGVQPNVRGIWTTGKQRAWASLSRALRTPTANEISNRTNFAVFQGQSGLPIVIGELGNPDFHAEEFISVEAGYRVEIGPNLFFDLTAFRGKYDHVQTSEPLAPIFETNLGRPHLFIASRLDNLMEVDTRGTEVAVRWTPTPSVRFDGSYSSIRLTPRFDEASKDPAAAQFDGDAPRHQWQFHWSVKPTGRLEVAGALYHAGRLGEAQVPAYTRADARVELKLAARFSLVVTGANLFTRAHPEFGGQDVFVTTTQAPRRANAQLRWRL